MKRLKFLIVFLLLSYSLADSQMIVQQVSSNRYFATKLLVSGHYIYSYNYSGTGGVFRMKSDLSDNWQKMVNISGEGDMTITPRGYIVASGRNGTLLSTDSGKTWSHYYIRKPFALQALDDGSVLSGNAGRLYRIRLDIDTNISNPAIWEIIADSSLFGYDNTPRFLYRLANGRIIMHVFGAGSMEKQGIWYSDNNGQTWTRSNYTFYHLIESATDDGMGNVMVADDYGHIYLSEDTAKTWRKITRSEIGDVRDSIGYVRYVYYCPSIETWFICGRDRLFYSIDVYH